ncbi:MAG: choice-of-anchor J domain-containing protein [Pirellulales bacterium]|nr:choice-of-anchor J domain-containing protein [Pirellulales bacterium]
MGVRRLRIEQLEARVLLTVRGIDALESIGFSLGPYVGNEGQWLDFDISDGLNPGASAQLELTSASREGVSGEITIPGVWLERVAFGDAQFLRLTIPGCGYTNVVGEPQLPILRQWLAAPAMADGKVQMDGQSHLVSMTDLGLDLSLAPVQAPVMKLPSPLDDMLFDFSELVYQADQFTPQAGLRITEDGIVAGQHLIMLEVTPISFNPTSLEIEIIHSMTFQVDFGNGPWEPPDVSAQQGARLADLAINYSSGDTHGGGSLGKSTGRLLIITHDLFSGDLASYIQHKTSLGWTVDVADTSTAGTTNTAIRNYIQSRYNDLETRPDAVLLVGDTNRIPHFVGSGYESPDTDLYYGCMDGGDDWYQEFPVGRFSVASSTELVNVIEKTIDYETSTSGDWIKSAVFMASEDQYTISEGTHNWVIDHHLDPLGYASEKLYQVTYNATTQDVQDAFNAGVLFGVYSGHGSEYGWEDGPPFYQNDVLNLNNEGMYPFVASFACMTGDYVLGECFMETWLRSEDNGAVVAVGSSVNSFWDEDDILEKRLFDAMFDEGYLAYGQAWIRAKELLLQHYGATSTIRRYFEMYNVFGDPTLEVLQLGTEETGPMVLGHTPEAQASGLSTIAFQFSEAMDTSSFSVTEDVVCFSGPAGDLISQMTGFAWNGNRTLEIYFNEQTLSGDYSIVIGPNITDNSPERNPMDQDGDGVNGEVLHDLYTAEFRIIAPIYMADMSTDPGWILDSGLGSSKWEWGQPTGDGGEHGNPDPAAGWTGAYVMGYNLQGDYANNILATQWATTPAIDCTNYESVSFEFRRWLNIEDPAYDHASVQVSNDGAAWSTLWANTADVTDSEWVFQAFDISNIADGESTVYLRWGLGTTDGSWRYSGWNIDDVLVLGTWEDHQAPRVANVFIRDHKWPRDFLDAIDTLGFGQFDDGYGVPAGSAQLDPIPWIFINTISIAFDEHVAIKPGDLRVYGTQIPEYTIGNFFYDPTDFTATWTLQMDIGTSDVLQLFLEDTVADIAGNALDGEWVNGLSIYPSGDRLSGGDFQFHINLVPGDVNRDGTLNQRDIEAFINHWGSATVGMSADGMIRHGDLNFSGTTDDADWRFISQAWTKAGGDPINLDDLLAAKSGDFNNDQATDAIDYQAWLTGFGNFPDGGAAPSDGDADSDGDVDGNDFLIWQRNCGSCTNSLAQKSIENRSHAAIFESLAGNDHAGSAITQQAREKAFLLLGNNELQRDSSIRKQMDYELAIDASVLEFSRGTCARGARMFASPFGLRAWHALDTDPLNTVYYHGTNARFIKTRLRPAPSDGANDFPLRGQGAELYCHEDDASITRTGKKTLF